MAPVPRFCAILAGETPGPAFCAKPSLRPRAGAMPADRSPLLRHIVGRFATASSSAVSAHPRSCAAPRHLTHEFAGHGQASLVDCHAGATDGPPRYHVTGRGCTTRRWRRRPVGGRRLLANETGQRDSLRLLNPSSRTTNSSPSRSMKLYDAPSDSHCLVRAAYDFTF
jgi:hypothetical protein